MSLSVIVPTLNEADQIGPCLHKIREEFSGEIIVSDGKSEDDTPLKAAELGATVLDSERGLAQQCNAAGAKAQGEVLFFVAADSRVPRGWTKVIEETLSASVVVGGFTLGFANSSWRHSLIRFGSEWRARRHRITLPDQGLFLSKALFTEVGGLDATSLIPYASLCRKLRSRGEFVLRPERMISSDRKWVENGWISTVRKHGKIFREFQREESSCD